MDFTIVAPCFDEEENIPELVFLFRNEMRGQFVSRLIKYSKKNKNIIITPHLGGYTEESVKKTDLFILKKFTEYIKLRN